MAAVLSHYELILEQIRRVDRTVQKWRRREFGPALTRRATGRPRSRGIGERRVCSAGRVYELGVAATGAGPQLTRGLYWVACPSSGAVPPADGGHSPLFEGFPRMVDILDSVGSPSTQHLVIERHGLVVELRTAGRLVSWLGPALRGITALRHRAAECRQPQDTWRTTWRYCRGCHHMPSCGYGQAFEPDAQPNAAHRDAPRPLVLSPEFPVEPRPHAGSRFHVDVTAIGRAAVAALPNVLRAITDAGRLDGLGPDRVRFNVTRGPEPPLQTVVRPVLLPKQASPLPVVQDVTIRLSAPLFLRERGQAGSRRQVLEPELVHLVRASMRMAREFLGEAALCTGRGHLDLDDLAAQIQPTAVALAPFTQEKASYRSGERFGMQGVTGHWQFASLPACLVPWLQLGGILGVGGHRIAGAGRWNLSFGAAVPPTAGGEP